MLLRHLGVSFRRHLSFGHSLSRRFTVLAFESSADDTAVAVVTSSRQILSNVVISQHEQNELFGGIQPATAVLAHQKNMPLALRRALEEANLDMSQIDGIAFTRGPGMAGPLAVACNSAKALAAGLNKPLVAVHHMQAHALTPLLTSWPDVPRFPFLTVLVSGGHTLILVAKSLTSFQILASTCDEAIGRTFDKVSRMLGMPWSNLGLAATLERFCAEEEDDSWPEGFEPFPAPMPRQLSFSYAAFHSHLERYLSKSGGIEMLTVENKRAIARNFQTAAIAHLEEKLRLAFKWCERQEMDISHLVVSGGVASNLFLRQRLAICVAEISPGNPVSLMFPPPHLCTDNAVMVAWASMHRFLAGDHDKLEVAPRAKWSIEDLNDVQ
ncbi:Gcp-like domain-containing protein [Mycena floridula]|nr:Gcp-like domain-containing protein [Mycena floridula]